VEDEELVAMIQVCKPMG